MKSFLQLLAERFLPPLLSMEINKKEREYIKGKNMYKIVKSLEEIAEPIENLDIRKNIIMCSTEGDSLIRQNIDGTFGLILNRNENLSMGKTALSGNMSVIEYAPPLKMCVPQGIKISIDDPSFTSPYFDKIYPECRIVYPDNKEKDSADTGFLELPANYYLTDFRFTVHIDIHRLRDARKTFQIKKGQSIASIYFMYLLHANEQIDEIIYIKNNEVFKTFLNIF